MDGQLLPPHIEISTPFLLMDSLTDSYVRGCRVQVLYYAMEVLLCSGHEGVYATIGRLLQLAQTAVVLEVHRPLDLASFS